MTVLAAGGLGATTGRALSEVLAGLRRGARARPGVCEVAVTLAVVVPVACGWLGAVASAWVPAWVGVGVLAVAVGITDLARRRIPNAVTGVALVVLPVLVAPLGPAAVLAGLGGAAAALTLFGTVHLLAPRALGAGDVKLAGVLGIPLAAGSWWALAAVPVLAAVLVVLTAAATRRRAVALGPLLAGAAWVLVAATGAAAGAGPP